MSPRIGEVPRRLARYADGGIPMPSRVGAVYKMHNTEGQVGISGVAQAPPQMFPTWTQAPALPLADDFLSPIPCPQWGKGGICPHFGTGDTSAFTALLSVCVWGGV